MKIHEALREEHSKQQTMRIVEHIGRSKKRFGELVDIVTGDDKLLAQRGSWVIAHCAENQPSVVLPHLGRLLEHLRQQPDLHDAIKRNTMKAASILPIPDDIAGHAADLSFAFLGSEAEAIATRVYSMSVLHHICEREPALVDELRLHIEDLLAFSTAPAFRSRARHVLKGLDRIQGNAADVDL